MINKDEILKVVWICHFTNEYIQDNIKPRKRIPEFAPWITLGIEEAKKRDDIELHIVSPHFWISRTKEFVKDGIHYHFFNSGIPYYGKKWPYYFSIDYYTKYGLNRLKIKKFVNRIQPDIINLHGVENAYYSTSILNLKKYPILITIQGFKSLNIDAPNTKIYKGDLYYERKLISSFENFGIRVKFLEEFILKINSAAKFYWFKYPFTSQAKPDNHYEKQTDCVFFGRITKSKGIEDLIDSIEMVKLSIPNISLRVIGSCNEEYLKNLHDRINNKGLKSNIVIHGFLKNQGEVHNIVQGSRIVVLPTYNDILPGTIIESLIAGIPVIAYAANGVVDFNNKRKVIKLVKLGDISELANSIIQLLKSPKEQMRMHEEGINWAKHEANNELEFDKLISAYKEIITKYKT